MQANERAVTSRLYQNAKQPTREYNYYEHKERKEGGKKTTASENASREKNANNLL